MWVKLVLTVTEYSDLKEGLKPPVNPLTRVLTSIQLTAPQHLQPFGKKLSKSILTARGQSRLEATL